MSQPILQLSERLYQNLWKHVLASSRGTEEVAFLFARYEDRAACFSAIDWYPVPPEGFETCSPWHFELRRETQAAVIKRAHDLGTGLIEVHSHDDPNEPTFSASDLYGFEEFVPHVWWRLKQPYAALVIAPGGVDGLAWIDGPRAPLRLHAIHIKGASVIETSKQSHMQWASWMDRYSHE